MAHLIQSRVEALERLAEEGTANRLSHNMAYLLFANNLVDYDVKYRGMQSVILNGLEAVADITLSTQKGGTWTVPPYFIDSVAHLAGFIMNVSDAIDTKANYCVTPGWRSMRFARPLVPGGKYRSYVKMIPTTEDPSVFFGDIYIMQDDIIMGMVGGIQFRRYPRILLNRFFSAPDDHNAPPVAQAPAKAAPAPTVAPAAVAVVPSAPAHVTAPVAVVALPPAQAAAAVAAAAATAVPAPAPAKPTVVIQEIKEVNASLDSESTAAKAIALVAKEAALELSDLQDEASFASLGIDSLMSLVIAERFREDLGVTVGGSLFLEYPTVGDLRSWLEEYYS